MRKFIFSILLASAAASPALAQDHGRRHQDSELGDRPAAAHEQRQEQHSQVREERSGGGHDFNRGQQQVQQAQPQQQSQVEARHQQWQGGNFGRQQNEAQQQQWQGRGGFDGHRFEGRNNAEVQQQPVQQQQVEHNYRNYRGGFAGQGGQVQQNQSSGSWARDRGSWSQNRDGDFRQRQGEQQATNRWSGNWNRDWRNDRRYDWRRYRNSHRSLFSLGIYYDPFGFGYRSFNVGYRFQPAYFGEQYWIDPALYGLPYPPPGTQWVRYWNDAVLVDMYSGQVVDVIRDFFW